MGCNYTVIELKYQPHSRALCFQPSHESSISWTGLTLELFSHQTLRLLALPLSLRAYYIFTISYYKTGNPLNNNVSSESQLSIVGLSELRIIYSCVFLPPPSPTGKSCTLMGSWWAQPASQSASQSVSQNIQQSPFIVLYCDLWRGEIWTTFLYRLPPWNKHKSK